ncbi:MAG: hypothetical protein U1E15_06900 [Hyphomicrobiales bacterium]
MRHALIALALLAAPALADNAPLNFDIAKLCAWQAQNNAMDTGECSKMETEAQGAIAALEAAADAKHKEVCQTEARNYSGDSGFASYTVYAGCLKDGPGSN